MGFFVAPVELLIVWRAVRRVPPLASGLSRRFGALQALAERAIARSLAAAAPVLGGAEERGRADSFRRRPSGPGGRPALETACPAHGRQHRN